MNPDPRSVRGRLHTLRKHVRSPSDAFLVLRLLAWRLALAILKRTIPITTLVRWMARPTRSSKSDTRRIVELVDWLYAPRGDRDLGNCLDRSLVLYRYLSRDEPGTRLVLGMRRGSSELEGHAWVIAGDRTIGETPANGGGFVPLATFAADGRRLEAH